jgi:NitT/TauT family transport system substrate-binding protein
MPFRIAWRKPVSIFEGRLYRQAVWIGALFWVCCWIGGGKAAADERQVTYRLKWLRNMSTAGDLFAEQEGYFKEAGLEVTLKPGGPERDPIRELELGYADFGVASADQVVRAMDKGSPVVVVAQLFQVNPLQWIYRQQRFSIRGPEDLRGRTIGVTFGKNDELILQALLARARIPATQVRLYGVRLDYTPFFKNRVDLWPVYINTQGVEIGSRLTAAGEQVAYLNPSDFGIRFVANALVTTQATLDARPDLTRRFVHAVLRGWRQALDPANGRRVVEAVRRFDQDSSAEVLQRQLEATRKLVQPRPDIAVGTIDREGWRQTESIMLDHKQISKPVHVLDRLKSLAPEKR